LTPIGKIALFYRTTDPQHHIYVEPIDH